MTRQAALHTASSTARLSGVIGIDVSLLPATNESIPPVVSAN